MDIPMIGALCFGAVMGWITYRTLRRKEGAAALSDVATVAGAVGGAAITALFKTPELFGMYCIGLFIGFFAYFIIAANLKDESVGKWMGK